jgi:hypothetical protein
VIGNRRDHVRALAVDESRSVVETPIAAATVVLRARPLWRHHG